MMWSSGRLQDAFLTTAGKINVIALTQTSYREALVERAHVISSASDESSGHGGTGCARWWNWRNVRTDCLRRIRRATHSCTVAAHRIEMIARKGMPSNESAPYISSFRPARPSILSMYLAHQPRCPT
ncbi:hypothetical protein CBOM_07643 [Ceraceosorus bombacis]|uniref:Uncharacterized protein n=1 Tax=Ceraceosorus bombacis TaxID=401625 RepID=A0A0P1BL49_9BASI|nr:hypothetical protein CBOM_07643 [Ceraceosorus bombacis]